MSRAVVYISAGFVLAIGCSVIPDAPIEENYSVTTKAVLRRDSKKLREKKYRTKYRPDFKNNIYVGNINILSSGPVPGRNY